MLILRIRGVDTGDLVGKMREMGEVAIIIYSS
jgi:carbamoylphosphate synthase small subunit